MAKEKKSSTERAELSVIETVTKEDANAQSEAEKEAPAVEPAVEIEQRDRLQIGFDAKNRTVTLHGQKADAGIIYVVQTETVGIREVCSTLAEAIVAFAKLIENSQNQ